MPAVIHSNDAVPTEALAVARFITDMTAELKAIANAADLELLAHFLAMAHAEGKSLLCGDQADQPRGED